MAYTSPRILPLALLAGVLVFVLDAGYSFVAGPQEPRRTVALRATDVEEEVIEERNVFGLPKLKKPDKSLINKQAMVGQSVDQDKKGNVWSQRIPRRVKGEDRLPAGIYIPIAIAFVLFSIVFLAEVTGQDDRFGGGLGEDQRAISDTT